MGPVDDSYLVLYFFYVCLYKELKIKNTSQDFTHYLGKLRCVG
jgi:hypothetical protein